MDIIIIFFIYYPIETSYILDFYFKISLSIPNLYAEIVNEWDKKPTFLFSVPIGDFDKLITVFRFRKIKKYLIENPVHISNDRLND